MPAVPDIEAALTEAASAGVMLDLTPDDEEPINDPRGGDGWGPERTVDAALLADLALGRPGAPAPRRISLSGARIVGEFDLSGMQVGCSLLCVSCRFEERAIFDEAEIPSLRLPGCAMPNGLSANAARLRGSLLLGQDFTSDTPVQLRYARIDAALLAAGARLKSGGDGYAMEADGLRVGGAVVLARGFTADGGVSLVEARLEGPFVCSGGRFSKTGAVAIAADGISVDGAVFLDAGFEAEGEVRLVGSRINGELVCIGGKVSNSGGHALSADRATMDGGMYCRDGFQVHGQVRMPNAQLGGPLDLTGGRFANPGGAVFVADGLSAPGILWGSGFEAEGGIRLPGARIRRLLVRGTTRAEAEECAWNLQNAQIDQSLVLQPAADLSGWVDLRNARVRRLFGHPRAWAGGYELGGLSYDAYLIGAEEAPRRWWQRDIALRERVEWLRGNRSGYQPQIYDELAAAYGRAGQEVRQRAVLIAKQRDRRRELPVPARLWSLVQHVLVGYGYRTWQALVPFVFLLVAGVLFFDDHRSDITEKTPAANSPEFKPLIYTLDLLIPVVNLGQRENWVPADGAQVMATCLVIAGWVFASVIVATLTGVVRRS